MNVQPARDRASNSVTLDDRANYLRLLTFHLEQALGIADELGLLMPGIRICDALIAMSRYDLER